MQDVIPSSESLTVEFKSDRKRLPDTELVEAVVCLANAEGGELRLGVEDDGTPTGLHPDHLLLAGLAGMVAARTSPSVCVSVSPVEVGGVKVACIRVPKAQGKVATQAGVYLRRRIKHDGTPECAPMLPHERTSRASSFGLVDVSAQPVAGATLADFDPLERERLRQAVPTEPADLEFRRLVDEERRRNAELPIDSLIALGALRELKRLTVEELAERIQRDVASAKRTLEALTEAGFIEAHGATRGRTYMLSAAVYGAVADKAAYTRQAGFSSIQHEQMVLSYVRQHGRIKRAEAMGLCRLREGQVKNLLKRMCKTGALTLEGAGPAAYYRVGSSDRRIGWYRIKSDEIGSRIQFAVAHEPSATLPN